MNLPAKNREGGCGLLQLDLTMRVATLYLDVYLNNSDDWSLEFISNQENKNTTYPVTKRGKEYRSEYNKFQNYMY